MALQIDFPGKSRYNQNKNPQKRKYAHSSMIPVDFYYTFLWESVTVMGLECIKDADLEQTGFNYTMSLIQGKYKMFILYALMGYKVVRFNELKKYLKTISYKTLSANLKELEADGLVHREEYPQIPPKVEYSLTERGRSLIPILDSMCEWGVRNRP